MTLTVVGAGAFGSALACALSSNEPVTLLGRDDATMKAARNTRNVGKLPGVTLPDDVIPTADPSVLATADCILLCIPTQSLAPYVDRNAAALSGKSLVACCKGVDGKSLRGPVDLLDDAVPSAQSAILTGPSFATDIARGRPTALTLAAQDVEFGTRIQERLKTRNLRIYRSEDITGAQLGGALKNIVAIAAGACIGANLGDSARAAIIARGFAEMQKCALHFGAQAETLMGLSGLGDLVLTCTSPQSRNYAYGVSLGQQNDFDPNITVEGSATAQAIDALADRHGLEMPVCRAVKDLVTGQIKVDTAMERLLARPAGKE